MTRKYKDRLVALNITSLSKKGHGIGSIERPGGTLWQIEVPFTLPGDEVEATLIRKQAGIFSSRLSQIATPSKERIDPRCKHFGTCGGCTWQQWPYERQLEEKQRRVAKEFQSFVPSPLLQQIIPCTPPWNYRNKMEFSFSTNGAKTPFLGLMLQGSRGKVFNVTECHLTSAWFSEALAVVHEWWKQTGLDAYHPYRNTGSFRTLTLREGYHTGDRMVILTVSGNPEYALNSLHLQSFVKALKETLTPPIGQLSLFLRIQQCIKGQPTQFYEIHLAGPAHLSETLSLSDAKGEKHVLKFKISPTAFFQPNTAQAEVLYTKALEMAALKQTDVVYDLYCGTGTLSLLAAKRCQQVVGIELCPGAVLDAKENGIENGCTNVTFLQGDVGETLHQIETQKSFPPPDAVMVDPPRAGLDAKALQHLLNLDAEKIVYVSCNPATQAVNIKALVEQKYDLITLQPVDQFPHTPHIENIAILRRK